MSLLVEWLLQVMSVGLLGLAEHRDSPGTPKAAGVPGSRPYRGEGKSRTNMS